MKIGVMNNPRNDLLKEIEWILKNSFDFIDLTIEPVKAYDINIQEVKEALKKSGLGVIGHTNPFPLCQDCCRVRPILGFPKMAKN